METKHAIVITNQSELIKFMAACQGRGIQVQYGLAFKFADWNRFGLRFVNDKGVVKFWDSDAILGGKQDFGCKDFPYSQGAIFLDIVQGKSVVRWNDLKIGDVFQWGDNFDYVKLSAGSYASLRHPLTPKSINDHFVGIKDNHIVYPTNKKVEFVLS